MYNGEGREDSNMKTTHTINTLTAAEAARHANSITNSTAIAAEVRPIASDGERSETERAIGLTSAARSTAPAIPDSEVPAKAVRRRFSAKYKLKILEQFDN